MDSKNINEYLGLVTSQHRQKTKFIESIRVAITPIVGCQNLLSKMSELHDLETATGNSLEQLALWTGTPLIIPGAAQLEYFGFIDQENAMTFGETDDPSIGGYFRESGQSGTGGLTPAGDFLRRLIKARILKNKSTGNINETKPILELALNHSHFKVFDNKDMTVTFKNLATQFTTMQKILVQMFFPLPAGVELIIED
ncbi:DUF2612 domain-containing protein [Acinetobacter johnsonii]|uniref:DUF2612 domain-containing protein n=1 Tax=Acinetobacter johnsonii TaxID=40214 RepID=UPI00103A767B|nr:DUF2612 domain-containing protein [Acinetobacter johnsonii]QBK69601.1 DUF2612 domain-containing protein [Acinetobacter johnsonii]